MEREMFQVKVYISDAGNVCISQEAYPGDDDMIVLHPSQVETVVQWLKEALASLKEK